MPALGGTGAVTGPRAADLTVRALDAGADGALVLSPPQAPDLRRSHEAVAKAVAGGRLMTYHFPFASTPGIPVEVPPELPVTALKDSSANPERLLHEAPVFDGDIYVGSSAMLSMGAAIGVAGAILALANVEPDRCAAACDGDGTEQRAHADLHRAAGADFRYGIKRLEAERFGFSATARVGR